MKDMKIVELKVDGGLTKCRSFMQLEANILQKPIRKRNHFTHQYCRCGTHGRHDCFWCRSCSRYTGESLEGAEGKVFGARSRAEVGDIYARFIKGKSSFQGIFSLAKGGQNGIRLSRKLIGQSCHCLSDRSSNEI